MSKEELESIFEDCYDRYTAATGGGYEADYTDKWAVWKDFWPHIESYAKIKSRERAIAFLEYHEKFRREEGRFFKRECDRLGGMFTLADYGVENIYNDFIAKKPIKSAILPVESFWQYDENDKLVHVVPTN